MQLNQKLILLISLLVGAFSFFLLNNSLKTEKKAPVVQEVYVIAAARDLDVGMVVKATHLRSIVVQKGEDISTNYKSNKEVIGKVVRNPIRRGQKISEFDLVSEDDNMAGLIPEGYRASAIPINLSKDTMSFLKFGNRVDVIFTYTGKSTNRALQGTKTILKNVLVMKVSKMAKDQSNRGTAYVTLAIKPEWAETLSFARSKGKLDLLVHPIGEQVMDESYMTLDELLGRNIIAPIRSDVEIELIRKTKKQTVRVKS